MSLVALRIIDAIGPPRGRYSGWSTSGFRRKVVIVDPLRFLTPSLAVVLELPHEFFFLRVDADPRVAGTAKFFALFRDVAKLLIALSMLPARVQHLAVAPQPILLVAQ